MLLSKRNLLSLVGAVALMGSTSTMAGQWKNALNNEGVNRKGLLMKCRENLEKYSMNEKTTYKDVEKWRVWGQRFLAVFKCQNELQERAGALSAEVLGELKLIKRVKKQAVSAEELQTELGSLQLDVGLREAIAAIDTAAMEAVRAAEETGPLAAQTLKIGP